MHTEPRNGAVIERIYLHTNEGPQEEGGAQNLATYLANNGADGGGYHVVVDDKSNVRCAADDEIVWAEGGDNEHALSVCMVGRAAQDWTTPYSQAEITQAAEQVAVWCKAYNVDVIHVMPGAPGQAPTQDGIAEHADDHDPASQGHTDPGAGFPIADFLTQVNNILKPPVDPSIQQWAKDVSATPLHEGDYSHNVRMAKALLAKAGFDCGNLKYLYGPTFANTVHLFKVAHKLANQDGNVLGAAVVKALGL